MPGIPGDEDAPHGTPSAARRRRRQRRWGEMQGRQARGHHPVHLFREGFAAGRRCAARPPHAPPGCPGRRRPARRPACWWCRPAPAPDRRPTRPAPAPVGEDARRGLGQGLPRPHHVQVVLRLHLKGRQHLVEHAAMLPRHAGLNRELLRPAAHVEQHRTEFDRFRTRAEDEEHTSWAHLTNHNRR